MSELSKYALDIVRLLQALGWDVNANRFTIQAVEPAFEPVTRTWMAGKASSMSNDEVLSVRPSRIIVEDFATADQLKRLRGLNFDMSPQPIVSTHSKFIDELWDAPSAVQRAIEDALDGDQELFLDDSNMAFTDRHLIQHVKIGNNLYTDHRALESALPTPGTWLALLSDAGLGKTEFLRIHEYRFAQYYNSALSGAENIELPPVAIRVSLRDFRTLKLDYIAHVLSQPAQEGASRIPLPRLSSGAVLRELLVQGRIILLLDGLDEVMANATTIDDGLREWHQAVLSGARIVVASRTGIASVHRLISRYFDQQQTASLEPLTKDSALELLQKRGANRSKAASVYAALAGPAATIPLYLVLANYVGLETELPEKIRVSKTLVLETLVSFFCKRETSRLGVDSATQMDLLGQIAEWLSIDSGMSRIDLLESLGIDTDDTKSRILQNPHALLVHDSEGGVNFKFPEFRALFTARSINSLWSDRGFNSVQPELKTKILDELVIEYLARSIHSSTISGIWKESEVDFHRGYILRRNLLAIALAKLQDTCTGKSAKYRSDELATILGSRSITSVSLNDLSIELLDFADWDINLIHGDGGQLSYCENLPSHLKSEPVNDLTITDCTFVGDNDDEFDFSSASKILMNAIKPLRRKGSGALVSYMSVDEARDPLVWDSLSKAGVTTRVGKGKSKKWQLTALGTRLLTSFVNASDQGPEVLLSLIQNDTDVRTMLQKLA